MYFPTYILSQIFKGISRPFFLRLINEDYHPSSISFLCVKDVAQGYKFFIYLTHCSNVMNTDEVKVLQTLNCTSRNKLLRKVTKFLLLQELPLFAVP